MKNLNTISVDEEGYHQAILNVCYYKWQHEPEWTYSDMLDYAKETYGDIARFAVLVGKLNQQVCNGGFLQYFDNGYAAVDRTNAYDFDLQDDLIEYLENEFSHLKYSDVIVKIIDVRPIIDENEYLENDYEAIINDDELEEHDKKYFEISDAWIEVLEEFFKQEMTK